MIRDRGRVFSRHMLALATLALAVPAWPQARLVKDIRTTPGPVSGNPSEFVTIGSTTYFAQAVPDFGTELWKTDGTTVGTVLVKDICPASCSSEPTYVVAVGSTLYFSAIGSGGRELWKSDGTGPGTVRVKDISPGAASSSPAVLTNVSGTLYFFANHPTTGTELWKSDGTEAGTSLVKDSCAGACGLASSNPMMTVVGNTLFFVPYAGQLWRSDGTDSGSLLVKDFYYCASQFSCTSILGMGKVRDKLVLTASTLTKFSSGTFYGVTVYSSDGTNAGTVAIKSASSGGLRGFATVGDMVIFSLPQNELYRSDGTSAGTTLLYSFGQSVELSAFIAVGNTVFFSAGAQGMWRTDGTVAGTLQMNTGDQFFSGLRGMNVNSNGTLYFTGFNTAQGHEIWKSDGTSAGTVLVKDVRPGAGSSLFEVIGNPSGPDGKGGVYFSADDGVNGRQIWKSDGTSAGTVPVYGATVTSSAPADGVAIGNSVYFTADDGLTGRELWKSDGTTAGTVLVKDINPGAVSSSPGSLTEAGGKLYFTADDGANGRELWRSDGTDAGTIMIQDLKPGSGSSTFRELTNVAGTLFFIDDSERLRKAANSGTGTTHLFFGQAHGLTALGNTLFFLAYSGGQLWKSDGTESGTTGVRIICADYHNNPRVKVIGATVFMVGGDCGVPPPNNGRLWKSDGTPGGTVPVKSLCPGCVSLQHLTEVNGTLFFAGWSAETGDVLWKSDGTEAGTVIVRTLPHGAQGAFPADFTSFAGKLFFTLDDGVHGKELWRSDGTAAGTVLFKDIAPDGSSGPTRLTVVGDTMYFVADDGVHGKEIWRSDGTPGGTALLQDVAPGPVGDVGMLVASPQGLFFTQASTVTGDPELWLAPLNGTVNVLRLYHPAILEHLYTTDAYEYSVLGTMGWTQEGQAYKVLYSSATYQGVTPIPLHRLYNPGSSQHLWTTDSNEAQVLAQSPHWSYEGPIGYVLKQSVTGSVPLYRMALANPSLHLWTTDANEYQVLQTRGWIPEGIIGYVLP
jgi:ELWxxDGT repeat protein